MKAIKTIFESNADGHDRQPSLLMRPHFFPTRTKILAAIALLSVPASFAFVAATPGGSGSSLIRSNDAPKASSQQAGPVADTTTQQSTAAPGGASNRQSVNISTSTSAQGNNASQPQTNVQVEVNGQKIHVPQTGKVHREVHDSNGQNTIDISVDNSQSSSTESSASSNITIDQYSQSTTDSEP